MNTRWALLAALLPYVVWLIFGYRYHFLDGVNLLLHEAGHVFFGIFGQTLQFLGGTLGQLLFPALFVGYFWWRRQRFEAFLVAIWFAESLMYTAEYMADAQRMALPLVGGGIHDWNWLFTRWGMLEHAEELGNHLHALASLFAIVALLGAGWVLRQEASVASPPKSWPPNLTSSKPNRRRRAGRAAATPERSVTERIT